MDNLYEIYLEQAKLMHKDPKVWKGHMIKRYMPQIKEIIEKHNVDTILDYGCGKAEGYLEHNHHKNWGDIMPSLYDPAIPEYEVLPEGQFDGVMSFDVLSFRLCLAIVLHSQLSLLVIILL